VFEAGERMPGVAGELQRFCVKGLRPEHHLVIAARIHTGTTKGAAALSSYSESQTKRRWDEVKDFVLVPLGLPPARRRVGRALDCAARRMLHRAVVFAAQK